MRVFITGVAHLGAAGKDPEALLGALRRGDRGIGALTLFATSARADAARPVAEVPGFDHDPVLPRTHALARAAAAQLTLAAPPDAVVLGGTTGGMPLSESLLAAGETDPPRYALHGTGTVALDLAGALGCAGPVLTVSTACSSGALAIKVGLELIRRGLCRTVLAGGVDALCRLTYHGFRLLKLIDPQGARPLDVDRRGMSVGEAAALLLLEGSTGAPPDEALAELRGVGASCDAHHATMPLPGGEGAQLAMQRALADAGCAPGDVAYINLHGTGTAGNDASEAAAVHALYPAGDAPPLSSTKGITGHPLAAAGAVEAVASTLCLRESLLPGNAGLQTLDPSLDLQPVVQTRSGDPALILSNSFGFGGNNASVALARVGHVARAPAALLPAALDLEVLGAACLSAAGGLDETMASLEAARPIVGTIPAATLKGALPPRLIRRLKRLPRMALCLSAALLGDDPGERCPRSVFFGTGWGPLSETYDFLRELFSSDEDLSSPTDFVGSVHNAPAGQLAMRHGARGTNLTATGGPSSFEQALLLAALTVTPDDEPALLLGADEHHPTLSPLLEGHAAPAEGGGALLVRRPGPSGADGRLLIRPLCLGPEPAARLATLDDVPRPTLALAGPGPGLRELRAAVGYAGEVLFHEPVLGRHASASALAAALAVELVQGGRHGAVLLLTPGAPPAASVIWRGGAG